MNRLLTLKIIAEECHNNKSDLFCCFVDFIKTFDIVLWNRLEKLKVPFEFRVTAIKLYEKVIAKFKNNEEWTTYINCNIGVKQGFALSPTIFGIYIDKLLKCLEEAGNRYNLIWDSYHLLLFLWKGILLISISN